MNGLTDIAALQVEVHHLTAAVKALDAKVDALTAQANRWKGAFGILLVVGGIAGGLATFVVGIWSK